MLHTPRAWDRNPYLAQQLSLGAICLPQQDLEPKLVLLSQHPLLLQLHPKPLRPQGRRMMRAFVVVPAVPRQRVVAAIGAETKEKKRKKNQEKQGRKKHRSATAVEKLKEEVVLNDDLPSAGECRESYLVGHRAR